MGYDPDFFDKLAELEGNSFLFRSRNDLIVWALRHHFPNALNFFEVGCGTGFVLSGIKKAIPRLALSGSDIYTEGLDYARGRVKDAELFQMDARELPFKDEFDIMGAFDILEHIEDDSLVLSQIYQAAKKGGGIILTVPQHKFLLSQADRSARHVRRYTAWELRGKVKNAGFKVTDTFSFLSLLLPIMAIARLKNRKSNKRYSILDELKPGGFANAAFGKVLDLERGLIQRGVRLPFGGSLFLIAHKI